MWESCIFASAKKLDNLCVVIDDNASVGAMVGMGSFRDKLTAFGFDVAEINGHDMTEAEAAFRAMRANANGRPKAVIAHTIRGYGSKTLTDLDVWFHKAPNAEELEMLCKEVDAF